MATPDRLELDVSRSEKKVWLVKVPNFVAKRWHEACKQAAQEPAQAGPELGRVKISAATPPASFALLDSFSASATAFQESVYRKRATAEGLPKEFNLKPATDAQSELHAFGSQPGQSMSVIGKVDQRFDTEMRQGQAAQELDPEYRRLSRERNRAAETKLRTLQVIAPQAGSRISASPAFVAQKRRQMEARQEKKIIEKRVRMGREDLESLLFRLFERQEFWNFQHLVTETDQPVAWLKEVLLALAVQHKKPGPNRDQWQLKPEYRTR